MQTITDFESPSPLNMQRIGAASFKIFCDAGYRIASTLDSVINFGLNMTPGHPLKVLDFGCGCGRVLLQLAGNFPHVEFTGADVDSTAVDFLQCQLPGARILTTPFLPPLPFRDGEFDIVYSISIWTHLAPRHQEPWLMELRRIVRPGGKVLISTSSESALAARKKRKDPGWESLTNGDLADQGVIFVPYLSPVREKWCPGVTEEYGLTLNHPTWIESKFSPLFSMLEVQKDVIDGVQDLVIMTR